MAATTLMAEYSASLFSVHGEEHMMTVEDHFKLQYEANDTPWDIGQPDFNLVQTVTNTPINHCKALDIGCGTGDNAIWLANHGFDVIGIDTSDLAIKKAEEKTSQSRSHCRFLVGNFLASRIAGAPSGFVFDRGLFHIFDSDEKRKNLVENVHRHLDKAGLWLSLIGNADEERQTPGPPQRSARNIVNAVEPCFEVLSLVSGCFGANSPEPPRAWVCLMRKRFVSR